MGVKMNLLFRRSQAWGKMGGAKFKLWGKVELNEDEQEIVKKYRFDNAMLIEAIQPKLVRNSVAIGVLVFLAAAGISASLFGTPVGVTVGVVAACAAGYGYFHEKRETIYVKDLIHGRHFTCDSVIDLARKEAWLETITAFLRQVMESAKHWDGTERYPIEALPKDEARQVIIRGL
mgnify:CR=1 FL=1